MLFGLLLVNLYFKHFFVIFEKKVLDQNRPYMYKHLLYKSKTVILSVVVVIIVVCVLAPAYTSLCRGLEYLLKVRYVVLLDTNGAGFLISNTIFSLRDVNTALFLKNTSQKWAAFAFKSK